MEDAAKKKDLVVVATVLAGRTGFVSGLDRDQFDLLKAIAAASFAPREYAQASALRSAQKFIFEGGKAFATHHAKHLPSIKEDRAANALKKLAGV